MNRFFKNFITFSLFLSFIGLFLVFSLFWYFSSNLPDFKFLKTYVPPVSTKVYDIEGLGVADFSKEKRSFIKHEQIPKKVIYAFLSAEDKNFFQHPGIDAVGITRAVIKNIQNVISGQRLEGASTITQQVAKNFLLSSDVSLARKVKEAILAFRIEKSLSKNRILELYLNEIYLGERSYGIASASMVYFDKSVKDLNFAESALLAALPKAPSKYNPYRNFSTVNNRKNWVLERMYENKYISKQELQDSIGFKINLKKKDNNLKNDADFFIEEVRKQLIERYDENTLYKQGLYVKTSLNNKIQEVATEALKNQLINYTKRHGWKGPVFKNYNEEKFFDLVKSRSKYSKAFSLALVKSISGNNANILAENKQAGIIPFEQVKWARAYITADSVGKKVDQIEDVLNVGDVIFVKKLKKTNLWSLEQIPKINGAVVVMNPWNGRVFALTGGFDFGLNQFNRATQALRQPGSSFKPIVYATALENNFKPNSIVIDAPYVAYPNSKEDFKWKPKNYSSKFYGPSIFRTGIEKSKNLMTIRIANTIGLEKINQKATQLGIYDKPPNLLSTSLGSYETTLLKLVSSYGTFVNGGRKINPTLIDLIQDRNGNTKYKNQLIFCNGCKDSFDETNPPFIENRFERVFDESTSYQIVNILTGVVQRGTARSLRSLNLELGGKTGTTNDNMDAWFIGFTPELLVGVYVGFDEPATLGKSETGSRAALPVFKDIMSKLRPVNFVPFFKPPANIKLVNIDLNTGKKVFTNRRNTINESFKTESIVNESIPTEIYKDY